MTPLPVVYVSDMEKSLRFYRCLGLAERTRSRSNAWVELSGPDGQLALHRAEGMSPPDPPAEPAEAVAAGRVTLAFVCPGPLEELAQRLALAGFATRRGIADEAFGRSLVVADPDGLLIQVNEHDEELYT
ncbi:VOC family protein [Natronosporangium hydrolyticum]|uniref:VOC family protein n=1 Tax=Natronosporangium hydrolyticum TaxID=2811111 RepID=A0A895YGY8_9ACTN|nr:VOC family protein [Natronosporangium hydrolyticum]QSB16821.1 VOC family protein [Natronosporangium hydrolyticum]